MNSVFLFIITGLLSVATPNLSVDAPNYTIPNTKHLDTYLLLAQKWVGDANFLDLDINGSFEAKLNGEEYYGLWEIDKNRETLILKNDPVDEDEFILNYTLSEVSLHNIKLVDKKGKVYFLKAS